MIINSRGGLIASAETEKEGSISAEISITELSDFRKRFPVMNDADDFTIAL
jgi:predicted amidohydrolase